MRSRSILGLLLIVVLRIYQIMVSPVLGKNCRFYPSCSNYGLEALKRHSSTTAIFLIINRLLSCQPWGSSGIDPVPESFSLKVFLIKRFCVIKHKICKDLK